MNTSTSNLPTIIFLLLLCFGFKSFSQTSPPSPHTHGQWSPVIEFGIVPVAIANLPDGRLVTWSSKYHDDFDMNDGYTFTQIFDPTIGEHGGVLPRKVTETFHDMFCPGINNLADGRILVTGGSSDEKTSIYDPKTEEYLSRLRMDEVTFWVRYKKEGSDIIILNTYSHRMEVVEA